MIGPTGAVRVMVATKPVDFRKGAEGLATLVREAMMADRKAPVELHRRLTQARMMICKRKGHRDLTIVLLAQLATILPCNSDRMPSLVGKARIVDDPSFDRPRRSNREAVWLGAHARSRS